MSGGTTQAIGPGEFVVVDSTGKQLGILLDSGDPSLVATESGGNWYEVPVASSGLVRENVYFATDNCTGTAYLKMSLGKLFPQSTVSFSGLDSRSGYALYEADGPLVTVMYPGSVLDGDHCDGNPPHVPDAFQVLALVKTLDHFTQSFRVERTTSLNFFQADVPVPELPQWIGPAALRR
jgi:hypothetical protein